MAEHGHGHSTAAWTAVIILLIAACLIALSIIFVTWTLAIIGIVLVVVGVAAGKILSMAGYGQDKPAHPQGTSAIR